MALSTDDFLTKRMTMDVVDVSAGNGAGVDQLPLDGVLVLTRESGCMVRVTGAFTYGFKGIRYVDSDGNVEIPHDGEGLVVVNGGADAVTIEHLQGADFDKIMTASGLPVVIQTMFGAHLTYCDKDNAWWFVQRS